MKNSTAIIGSEQIETNSELRNAPVGIGAAIAHLMHALAPADPEEESEPCKDFYRSPSDPSYDPSHEMEYQGEAGGTSFYKCRKCGFQSEV